MKLSNRFEILARIKEIDNGVIVQRTLIMGVSVHRFEQYFGNMEDARKFASDWMLNKLVFDDMPEGTSLFPRFQNDPL